MPDLPIVSNTVPANLACVISNEKWQELVALLRVSGIQASFYNYGNTTPAPAMRIWSWRRLNSDGTPDRWYDFAGGQWLSPHALPPGAVMMYGGNLASIDTFDGGEAGAVSATTGPFWERLTDMDAKFPIGPGTLPSTTVLAVGDAGGEEKHSLTEAEMPPHLHEVEGSGFDDGNVQSQRHVLIDDEHNDLSHKRNTNLTGGTGSPVAVTAHNTMPPYRAIWFIRRTTRLHYRAP